MAISPQGGPPKKKVVKKSIKPSSSSSSSSPKQGSSPKKSVGVGDIKAGFPGYIQLLGNMMDGGDKSASASSVKILAYLVLIIFLAGATFLGSGGAQSFGGGGNTTPQTQGNYTGYSENTSAAGGSGSGLKVKMMIISLASCLAGIVLMALALNFYKKGMVEALVSISVWICPMLIGGAISAVLSILIGAIIGILPSALSFLAAILAMIPMVVMVIAGVSAILFLYAATKALLSLKSRTRYFATIVSELGFAVGYAGTSILLGLILL